MARRKSVKSADLEALEQEAFARAHAESVAIRQEALEMALRDLEMYLRDLEMYRRDFLADRQRHREGNGDSG
jgi:hypothetical protein